MIELKCKLLHELAFLPRCWSEHAIWYDLHACIPSERPGGRTNAMVPARATRKIRTYVAVEPPIGHFLAVCSRSGLAGGSVFVANAPGIIDPDYRGEICVLLYNGSHETYYVQHGDRIAQLIALPAIPMNVIECAELSISLRGEQGFGSTGS